MMAMVTVVMDTPRSTASTLSMKVFTLSSPPVCASAGSAANSAAITRKPSITAMRLLEVVAVVISFAPEVKEKGSR